MALSLRVIPGYTFGETERIDQVKLNQLGRPTIELQGAIASSAILPGSITAEKLSPFLISDLTPKDPPAGSDLLMIQDAAGLRSTTISDLLELNAPTLETITAVTLDDMAWIIQSGDNKQASIRTLLRPAIHDQPPVGPLGTPAEIDPAKDELLLYDFSAPSGANQNRKATVHNTVRASTNTLIEDSPAFSGTLDRVNDELLIRRVAGTAGAQQAKIKLGDVLSQAGGIKAWVNFNGSLDETLFRVSFQKANETISTRAMNDPRGPLPTNLQAGDYIWTNPGRAIPGIEFWTPYYIHPASATNLELYRTKEAALSRDQSQRVILQVNNPNDDEYYFFMWPKAVAPAIRGSVNVSAVIRNGQPGQDVGYFRISFATALTSPYYATLVTGGPRSTSSDHEPTYGAISTRQSAPTAAFVDILIANDGGNPDSTAWVSVTVVG